MKCAACGGDLGNNAVKINGTWYCKRGCEEQLRVFNQSKGKWTVGAGLKQMGTGIFDNNVTNITDGAIRASVGIAGAAVGAAAKGLDTIFNFVGDEMKKAAERKAIQDAENLRIAKEQNRAQFEALKQKSQKLSINALQTVESIFCGDCGSENSSDDIFCSDCGGELN